MPGGYSGWAMKPMARVVSAVPKGMPESAPERRNDQPVAVHGPVRASGRHAKLNRVLSTGRKPPRTLPAGIDDDDGDPARTSRRHADPARSGNHGAIAVGDDRRDVGERSLDAATIGLSMNGYSC